MNAHTNLHSHAPLVVNRRAPLGLIALIFASLAVLSLSGCIGLTGAGKPGSSSNTNSTTAGTLTTSATSLNFGNVVAGSSSPQTLTLTNTGTATVKISQATVTGAGFSVVGAISSVAMPAGSNHAFQVQFAPTVSGSVSGSLSIVSDATNSPLGISLNGTGMAGLAITTQPASQTVTSGHTATFSVAAVGSGTLTYQWKKEGTGISGATSTTYTTPATTTSETGTQFSVVVTDSNGSITSNPATLTVTATDVAPSITSQPASATVTAGQTAMFSVVATGTAPLTYQWKKNGAAISGATSASYTTPATIASDSAAKFTVTVTNSVSSVTSIAATLTVNVPPSITAQPASKTVNVGQTATFSVAATGSGTLTYQWLKNGAAIGGATSSSYTTPATIASDNGAQFTVTVSDVVSNVTSNVATLTVNVPATAPSITAQPASKTVIAGQTATFSVAATGTAPMTYQWNKGGAAISGAISISYTTPATTMADSGAQFTVTVTNSAGKTASAAATLTVTAATLVLNASQASLNFSSVNLGGNSILPVTFANGGNSNVTISNVTMSGAGFSANGVQFGQILTPGQNATLNVTFTPSATGSASGSVTITSNATNSPTTVTLSGTGVQPVSHSVTLTWTASTSTVTGYNVYRSTVSGGPYTKLNLTPVAATTYTDTTVQSGMTYFFVVTSVDSSGVESANSTEVSATIP
jgi:centrosomal CEP192-like protein/ASPM-SPD-2-Hydin domain-containing protein/Ig-like domain-containing protein/immunoglobulin I-set domain protein